VSNQDQQSRKAFQGFSSSKWDSLQEGPYRKKAISMDAESHFKKTKRKSVMTKPPQSDRIEQLKTKYVEPIKRDIRLVTATAVWLETVIP
jgi:hypothetical protein